MNKTISITLAGLVFNIEETAYPVLKEYLDSIKQLFAAQSYGNEVYTDIEARIAEQFKKKLADSKIEVVTLADVNQVIKEMGTAADFGASEKTETPNPAGGKKLYRNSEDMIIAGVASGIAAYFGWDTTLVRIIFGLAVIFGGWGIPLYILLWIVMPEAKTSGQKLEMRGAAVTLKQLEQTVKEKAEQVKNSGFFGSVATIIGRIVRLFAKIIFAVVGGVIIFAASIAAFSTTLTAAVMLFNRNSPYVDPVLSQVLVGAEYYAAIIFGLITVLVPLMLLVLAGISLFRKKSLIKGTAGLVMLFVWLSAAVGLAVIGVKAAPKIEAAMNTSYPTITKQLDVKDFSKISAGGNWEVHIVRGEKYSAALTGEEKYINDANVVVEDGVLELSRKDRFLICFFCRQPEMSVELTVPALTGIDAHGAATVTARGFSADNFNINLSGASKTELTDFVMKEFTARISGASRLTITGQADKLIARLSGASQINGEEFLVKTAELKASGASKAYVNVSQTLNVEASGASRIYYKGNPETDIEDSGSSRVEKF